MIIYEKIRKDNEQVHYLVQKTFLRKSEDRNRKHFIHHEIREKKKKKKFTRFYART